MESTKSVLRILIATFGLAAATLGTTSCASSRLQALPSTKA